MNHNPVGWFEIYVQELALHAMIFISHLGKQLKRFENAHRH